MVHDPWPNGPFSPGHYYPPTQPLPVYQWPTPVYPTQPIPPGINAPPDPHVAALHAIAEAIDGLAAAVRGERAKVRDDGK